MCVCRTILGNSTIHIKSLLVSWPFPVTTLGDLVLFQPLCSTSGLDRTPSTLLMSGFSFRFLLWGENVTPKIYYDIVYFQNQKRREPRGNNVTLKLWWSEESMNHKNKHPIENAISMSETLTKIKRIEPVGLTKEPVWRNRNWSDSSGNAWVRTEAWRRTCQKRKRMKSSYGRPIRRPTVFTPNV